MAVKVLAALAAGFAARALINALVRSSGGQFADWHEFWRGRIRARYPRPPLRHVPRRDRRARADRDAAGDAGRSSSSRPPTRIPPS
jgi:hypothetical protein